MFSQKTSSMAPQGLPKEFFSRPELKRHESEFLISLAKEMCMEVIFYAQENGGTVKWKLKDNKEGVQIFQGEEFGGNDDLTYVCGVNTIRATLSEVADIFNISNEDKLAEYARVFEPDLIDMLSIYDLATPTPENPMHYIGVRWSAVESASPLVKNRDFCFLECQDEFVDTRTNKQGWVRCMHSINIPCCGSLEKTLGFVRGSYYRSGFVVVETDKPGLLDVTHILQVNFKGSVPAWIRRQTLRRRVASISRIDKFFQVKKLSAGRILGDIDLQPKKHVLNCHWCSRKFDMLFTRKFRCRKCGEVVCKHCSDHWYLHLPVSGEKRVRICTMCSATCRDSPEALPAPSADDDYRPSIIRQQTSSAHADLEGNRGVMSRQLSGHESSNRYGPQSLRHENVQNNVQSLRLLDKSPLVGATTANESRTASAMRQQSRHYDDNDLYRDPMGSRDNNYDFETMSAPDSSMYETNPFGLEPNANRTTDPLLRRQTNQTTPSEIPILDAAMPRLENRMRARDPNEMNPSYIESVRSIQLGSGWDSDSRTDLFNQQHFGESEVNLDTLDRAWSSQFAKQGGSQPQRPSASVVNQPVRPPPRSNESTVSMGQRSVVSHFSSYRYALQVPAEIDDDDRL
ncbi:unnamed protein product [Aphanomyces euteiches]